MTGLSSTVRQLVEAKAKATPGEVKIRVHPEHEDIFFVEARTYPGHPYHGVTNGGFGLLEDEDYPTKRADAEYVMKAWNDIPNLASAVERLEKLAEKWEQQAPNDWTNKLHTRAECAAELRAILGGQPAK